VSIFRRRTTWTPEWPGQKVPKRHRCVLDEPLGERCPWQAVRVVTFESTTERAAIRLCNWHAGILERMELVPSPTPTTDPPIHSTEVDK
jgi:hypothetical protein